MTGSIILTGANGSVGLHAAEQLLKEYPLFTILFTVRNAAETDDNTRNLHGIIERHPQAKVSIHQVDLANLSSVHEFADKVATGSYPPLKAIICSAAYWNLVGDPELTVDGFDRSIQVGHIAHVALIMRLIDCFGSDGGRIVLFSSIGHYRKPNNITSLLPDLPEDLDQLNHPPLDEDKKGRGFQRYANGKLMTTTWMYPLNHYLEHNPRFKNITAVAINPGGLGDSRCFTTNTPRSVQLIQKLVLKPFMPAINWLADPTFRSSADAAVDVVELAVNKAHPGERGYFTLLTRDESDPITMNGAIQQRVWKKSLKWAKITKDNTALREAVE